MVRKLTGLAILIAIFLAGCAQQYGGAVFPGGTTTTGPGLMLTTQQCPPGYSYSGGIEVFDAWAANTLSPTTPSDYTLLGFATNPGGRGFVNLCVPAGTSPLQIGTASTCPTNYANLGFVAVLQPGSASLQNLYFCTQTTANPLIRLVEVPRTDPNSISASWLMYEQNDPKCSAGTKPVGIISNGGYWTAEGKSAGKTYVKICAVPATITVAAPTPTAPTAPTAPTGPAVTPQPPGIPIPGIRPTAPTAPTGPVGPAPQAPYVPTAPVSPTMPAGIPMPTIPTIKPTAPTGTCIDSDGGRDYLIKGTITIVGQPGKFLTDMCQIQTGPSSYVSTPSCSAGSTCFLEEAWCDAPSKTYRLFPAEYYQCPYGCNDGACLSAPAPTALPIIIIVGDDCGKTAAEKCPAEFIEQGKIHVGVPANCGKGKIAGVSTSGKTIESGWIGLCVKPAP